MHDSMMMSFAETPILYYTDGFEVNDRKDDGVAAVHVDHEGNGHFRGRMEAFRPGIVYPLFRN
jgi:hypothetical protein